MKNHLVNLDEIPMRGKQHNRFKSNFVVKLLVLIAYFVHPAVAQTISHGTYYVAGASPEYAVVAIDSRIMSGTIINDNSCKIVPLSPDAFFFYWGNISISSKSGRTFFDAIEIAKNSFQKFGTGTTEIAEVANSWALDVIDIFNRDPVDYGVFSVGSRMLDGFFVGIGADGSVLIEGRRIRYQSLIKAFTIYPARKPTPFIDPMVGPTYSSGHYDITNEFSDGDQTKRASKMLAEIGNYPTVPDAAAARYMAYATAVRDWSGDPAIGGGIATIILERGQRWRWFNRPKYCPEKEN